MSNDKSSSSSKRSFGVALRQLFNQLGRMLEEDDPTHLFKEGSSLRVSLDAWHHVVETQTSGVAVQRARELEHAKLVALAKVASLEKETADLRERNQELREQIMGLHKREQEHKKKLLDSKFDGSGARADVERMDLEIRDLRRRIRELEGGPPLAPSDARPRSLEDLFKKPTDTAPDNAAAPKAKTTAKAKPQKTKGKKATTRPAKKAPKAKKAAAPKGKKATPKKSAAKGQKPATKKSGSKKAADKPLKKKVPPKATKKAAPKKAAPKKAAPKKAAKKAGNKKAAPKKAAPKKAAKKAKPRKK
jgi:hypothetical protein